MKQVWLGLFALFLAITPRFSLNAAAQEDPVAHCESGMELYFAGQFADAEPLLESGYAGRQAGQFSKPDDEGACALVVGLLRQGLGNLSGALEAFYVSLEIYRNSSNREFEAISLTNIGEVYRTQGRYPEALDNFQQALVIQRELGNPLDEAIVLNNIGAVYQAQSRYEEALEQFQHMLDISRESEDPTTEGVALDNIAGVYESQGRYPEALTMYEQALNIRRALGDKGEIATTLNNIGFLYDSQLRYQKALEQYEQALLLLTEIDNQPGMGIVLNNIGAVQRALGNYDQALVRYQEALDIFRQTGYRSDAASALNNIGLLSTRQGDYATGLSHLQQALTIIEAIGDRDKEAGTLANIGDVYREQGRYREALDRYEQALILTRAVGNRPLEGTVLNNIGTVYQIQKDYEEALEKFEAALAINREIDNLSEAGSILNNIGVVLEDQENTEAAMSRYQEALAIFHETGDRASEASALNNIGLLEHTLGQNLEATQHLEQALAIDTAINSSVGAAKTWANIARVYAAEGKYGAALQAYEQAFDLLDQVRSRGGSEQGRAGFIAQYATWYGRSALLAYRQNQPEDAFMMTERGRARAFLDSLVTGQVQLDDQDSARLLAQEQAAYAQRQATQDNLAQAKAIAVPDPDLIAELEQQLANIEATYAELHADLQAHNEQLAKLALQRRDSSLTVAKIRSLLDEQTTLLAYFLLEDNLLVFLLTQDRFEAQLLNVSPRQIETQTTAFRDFADVNTGHPPSAVTLYEMLIAPLKDKLTTPHLAIIPHQQLHYLPFAALTDGQRYLIDDYTLTVLPSASALPFIRENARDYGPGNTAAQTNSIAALVVGNPTTADYDTVASLAATRDSLGALPYAEKEAKAIAALFGVEPLLGPAATESSVREQVGLAAILHLAAHGQFNPTAPLNSFIALAPDNPKFEIQNPKSADGWLTVGEAYGLDLRKIDLVVLSACETNLGDLSAGDELVGLTRALIFAGTPSVVASLWAVEDEATALLMEQFYTHLREGMTKAAALRQAQIEVRADYPNPYYWSGFVLSGDAGEIKPPADGAAPPVVDTPVVGLPDRVPPPVESENEAGRSSSRCLSLLIILGLVGSIGLAVVPGR